MTIYSWHPLQSTHSGA